MKITTRRLKDIGFEQAQTNGNDSWFSLKLTRECLLSIQRMGSKFSIFHPKKNTWTDIETMKDLFEVMFHNGYRVGYRKHQSETREAYVNIRENMEFLAGT